MTTLDPESGVGYVPVLKALARTRGKQDVKLGLWCDVVRPGAVRIGDAVAPA